MGSSLEGETPMMPVPRQGATTRLTYSGTFLTIRHARPPPPPVAPRDRRRGWRGVVLRATLHHTAFPLPLALPPRGRADPDRRWSRPALRRRFGRAVPRGRPVLARRRLPAHLVLG